MNYQTIVVPVSGGKDSQLCLALALDTFPKEKIRAVHQSTGYDHPLTYDHLDWMESFYDIKIEYTKSDKYTDIFDLIEKQGYFPNNVARSCTGMFGINIHKAGTVSSFVENWSEGCQVFKRVKDFNEFMAIVNKAKDIHGNHFTYTLIESNDI